MTPDKYAVIGNPIKHSKSPMIHRLYAQQTCQDISYQALCFDVDDFESQLRAFIQQGGRGANVTVPFKQNAYEICDVLSDRASLAGAVNTLSFTDGAIHGNNTDGLGLVNDLQLNHSFSFKDKRVLIVGAGGAVRGILKPIIDCSPKTITLVNRTESKANDLSDVFSHCFPISVSSFKALSGEFDLIINGTSASLYNELPPLADELVKPDTVLYDMMYSKSITVFNAWGASCGAKQTIDGLGMLVGQAAESFKIWRSVSPDILAVLNAIRKTL